MYDKSANSLYDLLHAFDLCLGDCAKMVMVLELVRDCSVRRILISNYGYAASTMHVWIYSLPNCTVTAQQQLHCCPSPLTRDSETKSRVRLVFPFLLTFPSLTLTTNWSANVRKYRGIRALPTWAPEGPRARVTSVHTCEETWYRLTTVPYQNVFVACTCIFSRCISFFLTCPALPA